MTRTGMKCWQTAVAVMTVMMSLSVSFTPVVADETNPGVVPINGHFEGLTYGQWSQQWWEWAFSVPEKTMTFDDCPRPMSFGHRVVWFLAAPTTHTGNCVIPKNTAIMFPTFNAEWSDQEAGAQGNSTPGQTCLVPTQPNGTTYPALLACARAQADNATHQTDNGTATLEADVDAMMLQSLEDYRAHSKPPPFTFTPVPNNAFGLQPTFTRAVADGFWIILKPLSPGKHTIHFAATVPFPNVNPPTKPFTFTTEAKYCLIVQPSSQTCP